MSHLIVIFPFGSRGSYASAERQANFTTKKKCIIYHKVKANKCGYPAICKPEVLLRITVYITGLTNYRDWVEFGTYMMLDQKHAFNSTYIIRNHGEELWNCPIHMFHSHHNCSFA